MDISRYFADLGFHPGNPPSPAEVKKRWKELCRKHHPDAGGDKNEFIRVMHAYEMLTNPEYRFRESQAEARRSGQHNAFGDLNIRIQVPLKFEDAFFGKQVSVSYSRLLLDEKFRPVEQEKLDVIYEVVDIPPGSCEGFESRIDGGGHKLGDICGSSVVIFTVMPHPLFRLQGADVLSVEKIPLDILLKGGVQEVLTMYGLQSLKIPPGTKPGTKLSIYKKGVNQIGKHIVQVDAIFPSEDDLKGEAWKGMGINWETVAETDEEEASARSAFSAFSQEDLDAFIRAVSSSRSGPTFSARTGHFGVRHGKK